jgi:hypothetical protein
VKDEQECCSFAYFSRIGGPEQTRPARPGSPLQIEKELLLKEHWKEFENKNAFGHQKPSKGKKIGLKIKSGKDCLEGDY